MKTISFSFRDGVPVERQRELLESQIPKLQGVRSASALRPSSSSERVRRMSFAILNDDADEAQVEAELKRMPELESVETPTKRKLVR